MNTILLSTGVQVDKEAVVFNIKRVINQVYKLLPMREEGRDWEKPLSTLIQEISGMKRLLNGQDDLFFLILCKLEGLFGLNRIDDMATYRRCIFECLGLLSNLENNVYIK